MDINIFNHSYKAEVNKKLESITKTLRKGDHITAIHTPIVLPLTGSGEIGGYARSLGLPFGPKWIALDCEKFSKETPSMQEFILSRQVALLDKPSRYLHTPLGGLVIAVGSVAAYTLFPFSAVAVTGICTAIAVITTIFIAKREQENEKYADLIAFDSISGSYRQDILQCFLAKVKEEDSTPRSFLQNSFSSYPSYRDRHKHLISERTVRLKLRDPALPPPLPKFRVSKTAT